MFRGKEKYEELLLKENRKLGRENKRLQEEIDFLHKQEESLTEKKYEYESLIEQTKEIRDEYKQKLKDFEKIETEYKQKLQKVIDEIK